MGCQNIIKKNWQSNVVQKSGTYFNEILSIVVNFTIVKVLIAFVEAHDSKLEQLDSKTTFLHGDPNEQIYMGQLERLTSIGKMNSV